jgi:hypothetical protein
VDRPKAVDMPERAKPADFEATADLRWLPAAGAGEQGRCSAEIPRAVQCNTANDLKRKMA